MNATNIEQAHREKDRAELARIRVMQGYAGVMYRLIRDEYDAYDGFETLPLGYSADRAKRIMEVVRVVDGVK